ncbi:hypothetical protein E2C01_014630 [Portunus trituberculatus]|uniref:Uncharacterized protein n=1 Tax=Portunus trituberculatus TaxID=210409 RepID=A0A5B7DJQ9_PORTR|nr:hypothetical protein [Portunus trituberculatus]
MVCYTTAGRKRTGHQQPHHSAVCKHPQCIWSHSHILLDAIWLRRVVVCVICFSIGHFLFLFNPFSANLLSYLSAFLS